MRRRLVLKNDIEECGGKKDGREHDSGAEHHFFGAPPRAVDISLAAEDRGKTASPPLQEDRGDEKN